MKVMINLLSSSSGGALSYLRNLVPLIANQFTESDEHKLSLLLYASHKKELSGLDPSIECVEVTPHSNGYARVLWETITLPKIIKEKSIDVLFTPYQLAPVVSGIKNVAMIRNMEPFLFQKYRYNFQNFLRNSILRKASIKTLKRVDRVIAVSQFSASYCLNTLNIPGNTLNTIYHGRDKRFSTTPNEGDDQALASLGITREYFFTCGSMLPYRRCELIIDAFNHWAIDKNCELVIAGSSTDGRYQTYIQRLIDSSPIAHKIKWLGQVSPENMRVLYRHSKAFVTATEIEACPNIGIEALSSGCYIVSSNNDPLPEIFVDAADFYDADSTQELAAQLEHHFARSDRINNKALTRAEFFSWEACSHATFKALTNWNSH